MQIIGLVHSHTLVQMARLSKLPLVVVLVRVTWGRPQQERGNAYVKGTKTERFRNTSEFHQHGLAPKRKRGSLVGNYTNARRRK